MNTTANLGLKLLDPNDTISVDPFNENAEKIDSAIGRYGIVAAGKDGGWIFQKYSNGLMEAWYGDPGNMLVNTSEKHGEVYVSTVEIGMQIATAMGMQRLVSANVNIFANHSQDIVRAWAGQVRVSNDNAMFVFWRVFNTRYATEFLIVPQIRVTGIWDLTKFRALPTLSGHSFDNW